MLHYEKVPKGTAFVRFFLLLFMIIHLINGLTTDLYFNKFIYKEGV